LSNSKLELNEIRKHLQYKKQHEVVKYEEKHDI